MELLISSNSRQYTEFKPVTRVLTMEHGRQSRASTGLQKWCVQHQDYQCGEKRILMKFLIQSVREKDEAVDYDKTFGSYLKQQKFMFYLASTKKLQRESFCRIYCIAFC